MNVISYEPIAHFGTILVPYVACPAVTSYSTSSHKRHHFREQSSEHKLRVLIFSANFNLKPFAFSNNSARY